MVNERYKMTVLNFKKLNDTEIKMPNNLDTMIRRSGLLNKEVAERKGIRPETVSRHISGALQFTLKDAEEYAMILGCTAQDVLFVQNAVPLFGYLDNENVTAITPVEKERAFYLPWPTSKSRRVVISKHTAKNKHWANGRMYMFDSAPINKGEVDQDCYMNLSIVLVDGHTQPQFAVVYPEPGGTFSLGFNTDTHTNTDQSLKPGGELSISRSGLNLLWGCPIVSCIFRSELIGVVEKQF
jgi:hypothetical protein